MNKNDKTLGYYVRNARKLQNLTTQQLAKLAGLSTGYVNRIENDMTTKHNIIKLKQLAEVLHISDETILSRIGYALENSEKTVKCDWRIGIQNILQEQDFNQNSITEILSYIDTVKIKQNMTEV